MYYHYVHFTWIIYRILREVPRRGSRTQLDDVIPTCSFYHLEMTHFLMYKINSR